MDFKLERFELEALIEWHSNKMYEYADKQEYDDAAYHKTRRRQILDHLAVKKFHLMKRYSKTKPE